MARVIAILVLCAASAVLIAGFRHYHHSYAPKLRPPDEGWIHLQPRFYEDRFEEYSGIVRDHVQQSWQTGAEVSVLTETDSPFAPWTVKELREAFIRDLKQETPTARITDCRGFATEQAIWSCLDLRDDGEEPHLHQRFYYTRRGNSNVVVLFTAAPPQRFAGFGDPRRWLTDLEWLGPGLAYAF